MGYRIKGTWISLSPESWEMLCTLGETVGTTPQGLASHLLNGMLERLQIMRELGPEAPESPQSDENPNPES